MLFPQSLDARSELSSDAQALDQMEAARWKHENAGERRTLTLYRPEPDGWTQIGRTGSRSAEDERRSWIVVSLLDDGRERCDILNAFSAEDAARIAVGFAGVTEVASVEPRTPHP